MSEALPGRTSGRHFMLMSRSQSREGGVGHRAMTLDTHPDPRVDG